MLLSHSELVELVDQGVIGPVDPSAINAASIDVRLGNSFLRERAPVGEAIHYVDMSLRESIQYDPQFVPDGHRIVMEPGEFLLAQTMEVFNLPSDISAQFLLKSSIGRNALNHMSALWCDAGWHGSVLTLELKNDSRFHHLILAPGMYIGQVKFFRHTPVEEQHLYSARGRYNHDMSVSSIKP